MNFHGLNQKQQSVAKELEQNILLLASAGTGKTNTLAYRIENILDKKLAKPEEIVCLTFTNKACNEMKDRINSIAGGAAVDVMVKTIHGFCYEILRWAARQDSDIFGDFGVFDETDCLELIANLKYVNSEKASVFQKLINLVKEYRGEYNLFSPHPEEDYEQVILRLKDKNPQRLADAAKGFENILMIFDAHCGEILKEYDDMLRENHAVDFNDLINEAYRLLQQDEVAKVWQNRFKFWCVDEVQDISRLEYSLLTRMFGSSNLLLCGDIFQTIYEWRGSDPTFINQSYVKDYKPRLVVFNENYRSTANLLLAGFGYLKNTFPQQVAGLFPEDAVPVNSTPGELVVHKSLWSTKVEASWIYEKLQQLQPDDLSKVCILTRANWYAKELSKAFVQIMEQRRQQYQSGQREQQDFPLEFMLVDEFKFFRRQEIKDVVAALRLLINPQDSSSMLRLLKRFGRRIGPATIAKIQSEEYQKAGIRITDLLHPSTQKYAEPYEMLLRQLECGQVVVFDVEATGLDTARDEIIQIAAIKVDLQGQEIARFVRYLRAGKSVGLSEQVHHISDAYLQENGVEPSEALQGFCEFAQGSIIVGHNVVFDLTILASQLRRLGLPPLDIPAFYDTLDIYRRFYPQLPNYKLEYLGEVFHVQHKSSHDAFDDICATGEILLHAVRENILPDRDIRRSYLSKYVNLFGSLAKAFEEMRNKIQALPLPKLVVEVIMSLGINSFYAKEAPRLENLRQLVRYSRELVQLPDRVVQEDTYDALQEFLRLTAMSDTELDLMLKEHPKIPIITIHQAKGSEFDTVFLTGLQEGVFPTRIALKKDNVTEEARLFYVAITRARRRLFLTSVAERQHAVCRFIKNIPQQYILEDRK